ncbi:MAG: hypothetical protein KBI47_15775 [Armatimonadetes bacterium]|nr:hypothetical protein [Armatimonadota bacterium]MDI9584971.1 hypothetical protein [Acidobacteriota bacterium]
MDKRRLQSPLTAEEEQQLRRMARQLVDAALKSMGREDKHRDQPEQQDDGR